MTALEPLLLLHPSDNVAVARRPLQAGENLTVAGRTLQIAEAVPANHKVAVSDIREREVIRKFGQPIGSASAAIASGQWVHVQNVSVERDKPGYEFCTDIVQFPKPADSRTFMGFRRKNGQRRNSQLHRSDQHGELFGDDVALRGSGIGKIRSQSISETSTASFLSSTRAAVHSPTTVKIICC